MYCDGFHRQTMMRGKASRPVAGDRTLQGELVRCCISPDQGLAEEGTKKVAPRLGC